MKKSELYSSLWKSCDELHGGMDASQYKDYVLALLFVKYASDKYAGQPRALIEVPEGGSFSDMVVLKGDKEIGDGIDKARSQNQTIYDPSSHCCDILLGMGSTKVPRIRSNPLLTGLSLSDERQEPA
jgi:type I restriction-modification system DNA methylase subunit